jgi:hypothetical protein
MPLFSKRSRGAPTQADYEAVLEWERTALDDIIGALPADIGIRDGVRELLGVVKVREILGVVKRHPALASDEGVAAMSMIQASATMTGMVLSMPAIADRLALLRALRDSGTSAADLQLPADE